LEVFGSQTCSVRHCNLEEGRFEILRRLMAEEEDGVEAGELAKDVEGRSEEGAGSSPTDRRWIPGSGGDQAEGIGGGGRDRGGGGRGRKGWTVNDGAVT